MTTEDPRRYVRAMYFIKARIEDGTFKLHELMPSIQELSDQTGHSWHTVSKALRDPPGPGTGRPHSGPRTGRESSRRDVRRPSGPGRGGQRALRLRRPWPGRCST
jgi:DNA-binding transcriptional MocR family regulator